jgi:hypothetical protein
MCLWIKEMVIERKGFGYETFYEREEGWIGEKV